MARFLVSVDDNLQLPSEVRIQLKADVESDVSASVTAATTAASTAVSAASAAETARSLAQAAAASVTVPTDTQVAALVGSTSSTRAALDARYAQASSIGTFATETYVDDLVNALADDVVSVEDLLVSFYLPGDIPIGANTPVPLLVAPFPLRLTYLALTSFQATSSIATSDTNYWLTRLRYTRQSVSETAVNIATKTTRSSAGGGHPAGEAITKLKPWVYNSVDVGSVNLQAGDTVSMIFSPQGSVTAIPGPLTITMGYQPL